MKREMVRNIMERFVPGRYAFAGQEQMVYDPSLRTLCEANRCGKYGRSYTCPPAVGPVEELIARAGEYPAAALYQTVARLEDSFDYEGMMAAKAAHFDCSRQIQRELLSLSEKGFLHLSAGSCSLCPKCAIGGAALPQPGLCPALHGSLRHFCLPDGGGLRPALHQRGEHRDLFWFDPV